MWHRGSNGKTECLRLSVTKHTIPSCLREDILVIKFIVKLTACVVLTGALPLTCTAQNALPTSSDSSAQTESQDASKPASDPVAVQPAGKDKADAQTGGQGKVVGTSNDRLFYTLPNFLTLETKKQLPPMSVGDKFKVVALGTFDYVEYPWWGVLAAISQATKGSPAFGQDWEAYAKRYGTTAGDSMVENFMVGAVFLPS